ncbi:hypothetical protein D917_00899, partial [Trichinella nativa]
ASFKQNVWPGIPFQNFSGVPNLQICNNSLRTYPLVITSIKRTLQITTMSNEEEKGRTNGSKIALNNSNSNSKISLNVSHGITCQTSSKQKIETNALSSSQLYGGFINSYPNLSAEKPQPTFLTSSFAPYHPSLLNVLR